MNRFLTDEDAAKIMRAWSPEIDRKPTIIPGYSIRVQAGRREYDFTGESCNCPQCLFPRVNALILRVKTTLQSSPELP